ncbi:hypothetical protein BDW59DRAFT_175020 [Aspergillus cavernicola]|uniref:Uncharacterized protein n=1 Tax=Aspergillus cavernicola TaxID=176166 RepID=A0ABR4HTF9_9EURO
MTAIVHRLRRKRKLSSELDSRWGDMSISCPNQGSWSEYDAASTRASPVSAQSSDHDRGWNRSPGESSDRYTPANGVHQESRKASVDSALTMPTGHYDAKLPRRSKVIPRSPDPQPVQRAHITLPKAWEERKFGDSSADEAEDDISALGSPRGKRSVDDANSRGSKSPPLSVTSRMRRFSGQSTVTDPIFSMPGTASSQRTSFSLDDPRLARHTPHHDKKPPQQAKVRDAEPMAAPQELVPSYDDLYG